LKNLVEQIVYFTLGFVICGLIGLAFLPLVSARARRLTLARIEARLPMTFEEIEAERDLLRARFAVEKRALEIEAEQARAARTGDSAELGRRAVAVMRANEYLQETENRLRERDAQLAKSLEFGEKTKAQLKETQESLAARETELTQKSSDYDRLAAAREKLDHRAIALEAALAAAKSALVGTREKWEASEAARRESLIRGDDLAEQVKSLTAALAEAERLNDEFVARRVRLLAKIAAEHQRADELESVNLSMRRIIAQIGSKASNETAAADGETVNGAAFPFTPEQELLDLREAITRIGRQVAHLNSSADQGV
jgi:chromosome segregation ATPase